jgi:HYDIN/CFA65/VesB-like, Ig-like domain
MRTNINWLSVAMLAAGLSASGCGGSGGTALQPILSVNVRTMDFGNVAVNSTRSLEATFSNTGTGPLILEPSSISGAAFTASGLGAGVTLDPGQYIVLTVNFQAAAAGGAQGALNVSSSNSSSTVNIPLFGTGILSAHSATLNWDPASSNVVGYNVYRSPLSGGAWVRLNSAPIPQSAYTDWDAASGISYQYAVTSVSPRNIESAFSNLVPAAIPAP